MGVGRSLGEGELWRQACSCFLGTPLRDLALRDSSTCESSPSTTSLPKVGRKGMSVLVPKDLFGGNR